MPAHSTLAESDVKNIVQYVLSLKSSNEKMKSLPLQGAVIPIPAAKNKNENIFVLKASYTDNGGAGVKPLSASNQIFLRHNLVDAGELNDVSGFRKKDSAGLQYLTYPTGDGSIKLEAIDLTGILKIRIANASSLEAGQYQVEIRLNDAGGAKIGEGMLGKSGNNVEIKIDPQQANKPVDIFIVFHGSNTAGTKKLVLKQVAFLK